MYELNNKQTGEKHLCDKVTLDGYDYFVSGKKINIDDYYISWETDYATEPKERYVLYNLCSTPNGYNPRKVIATTNPDIDCPKVVDIHDFELRDLSFLVEGQKIYSAHLYDQTSSIALGGFLRGCKHGYGKSQETHPNSDEDMKSFLKFSIEYRRYNDLEGLSKTSDELLQLWKEQKTKTVYYE